MDLFIVISTIFVFIVCFLTIAFQTYFMRTKPKKCTQITKVKLKEIRNPMSCKLLSSYGIYEYKVGDMNYIYDNMVFNLYRLKKNVKEDEIIYYNSENPNIRYSDYEFDKRSGYIVKSYIAIGIMILLCFIDYLCLR